VIVRKDKDAEDVAIAEQAAEAAAPADEDVDEDAVPQVAKAPAAAEKLVETTVRTGPFGPAWGTMVHRVMELAVQGNTYTDTALKEAARQAVNEMLTEDELDKKQRGMLGVAVDASDEDVIAYLVPRIEEAVGFMKDEGSPLRQLLAGAVAYPELPFILQAKQDDDRTAELYRHLSAHISSEAAKDRTLAVEGIIDLAIRKDDGWYVVDYKTDKLGGDESKEAYMERLRGEYTPQITAYARVLEKMTGVNALPVRGAWLCSIPLGGRLIELDIGPK